MSPEEAQLVYDEVTDILPGFAVGETAACVDDPWSIDRAANKLVQLSLASNLGIPVPTTAITNSKDTLVEHFQGSTLIAKAVSSGIGLAPFAAEIDSDDWDFLPSCPTQIQQRVAAQADLRIVTIGNDTVAWERCRRDDGPLDWRQADPTGVGFHRIAADPTDGKANVIAKSLDLKFSVQDWLLASEPVFLEVNPQGQWLFLSRAEDIIPPLLADLLLGERNA